MLLLPFLEWSLTGMSFRFFLLFVLLVPLCISLLLENLKTPVFRSTILFICVLLMLGSIYSWKSYQPSLHDADYKKYQRITDNSLKYLDNSNAELVIAHNALAEYFTFTSGIDAMPWEPEYEIAQEKLWRIATDIREVEMQYYLKVEEMDKIHKLGIRYFLLPDHLWQKILAQAESNKDTFLLKKLNTWRNPHKIRPGFLLKQKSHDKNY